jgi:ribosomal protein S18 acetylase RimI-like enzyme
VTVSTGLVIRPARPSDTATLVALVIELATFEHARDEVELDDTALERVLFGEAPTVFCDVAESGGEIVGSSIWFVNYSTWTGTHGIYLEDLYVRPSARRLGIGKALIAALARRAVERGYRRVEWSVLDWNVGAIGLYESVGAFAMSEWTRFRLSGDALERFAATGGLTAI